MSVIVDAKKLAAVAMVQSTEQTRYYLCGVYFENGLCVATDGHRLMVAHDKQIEIAQDESRPIYPVSKKAITAMKNKRAISVVFNNKTLTVYADGGYGDADGEILHIEPCIEIDGAFPEWRRVLPNTVSDVSKAYFNAGYLADLDKIAKVLTGQKMTAVSIVGDDNASPHLVRFDDIDDVIGVLMPMKGYMQTNLVQDFINCG